MVAEQDLDSWEAAYLRFETRSEEVSKFNARLRKLGVDSWSKDLEVVELFCGRGSGIAAFSELGFSNLEGVDFSQQLLDQYQGDASLHCADCRALPFENASKDVVVCPGGIASPLRIAR